jgi:hypothetical protein
MSDASSTPVGAITAYAGPISTIPSNWLVCDGRPLDRRRFGALFDAIGTTWGGDSAPMFNLPDLRGEFLRGVDKDGNGQPSNKANDPDRDERAPSNPDADDPKNRGNVGNNVGSKQRDEVRSHSHTVADPGHEHGVLTRDTRRGAPAQAPISGDGGGSAGDWPTTSKTSGVSIPISGGGAETRARNAYVFWIIRAA